MIFTKGAHQSAKFQNFDWSGEISPDLHFKRFLLLKVYKISARKVQRSYVSWFWRVMQNFLLQKWQEFGEFWSTFSKVSNISTLICPFCAKYITFDQKSTEELSFMTVKSHGKFQEKLTCGLENDMGNLTNFYQNTWKCQNWYFYGIILSKVENTWAKNLQRNYL